MKWFYKWLGNKIKRSNESEIEKSLWGNPITSSRSSFGDNKLSGGMSFTVHRASGGLVVEHSHYDEKLDRNDQSIHVITDEQDLGESLAKILTIELLRR